MQKTWPVCQYQLCLSHGSDSAVDVCLCSGDFVLPANVKQVLKTSEVEVVHLFLVHLVDQLCLTAELGSGLFLL